MMEVTRCNYYHATISLTVSCDASDSFLLPANKGVSILLYIFTMNSRYQNLQRYHRIIVNLNIEEHNNIFPQFGVQID